MKKVCEFAQKVALCFYEDSIIELASAYAPFISTNNCLDRGKGMQVLWKMLHCLWITKLYATHLSIETLEAKIHSRRVEVGATRFGPNPTY